MASALSSTVFAIRVSSLRTGAGNPSQFTYKTPLRYNPFSLNRHISRSWRPVRGTLLEDNEVKVVVEETFKSSTLLDKGGVGSSNEHSHASSTDAMPNWTVKLEQSINIVLTVHSPVCKLPSRVRWFFVLVFSLCLLLLVSVVQDSVIKILDTLYHDRDYARFFVLETIARVPYFAFMSVLHMYESFGWWRRADYIKVHFAESWNEMHHLLIMEELGGNAWWFDRFLAQHIAIFYYFMTVLMYTISPRMAYHFSECVEGHAYSTYDKFIKTQGEELKELPAPEIAVKYYTGDDLYLFDEFQTSRPPQSRRPKIENLYDVFVNIRDDEAEHCKTMKACQTHGNLRSPHSYAEAEGTALEDTDSGCILDAQATDCEGIVDCLKKSVSSPSPPQKPS